MIGTCLCPICGEVMCVEAVDEPIGEMLTVVEGYRISKPIYKLMAIYYCETCGYQGKPTAIKGG